MRLNGMCEGLTDIGSALLKGGSDERTAALISFIQKHPHYSARSDQPPRLTLWGIKYLRLCKDGRPFDLGDESLFPPRAIRMFNENDHAAGSFHGDRDGVPVPPLSGDELMEGAQAAVDAIKRAAGRRASRRGTAGSGGGSGSGSGLGGMGQAGSSGGEAGAGGMGLALVRGNGIKDENGDGSGRTANTVEEIDIK